MDTDQFSPARLFINLWRHAGAWSPEQRLLELDPQIIAKAENALERPTAQDVFDSLNRLLGTHAPGADAPPDKDGRGKILAIMQAIDGMFFRIHPRARLVATSAAPRPNLPNWLRELRDNRSLSGDYGDDGDYRLIPRGPLLRSQRDKNASNAESFADRFAALTVVPHRLLHENRPIKISQRVIGADMARGVIPSRNSGEEIVAFIPIAEQANDFVISELPLSGQKFVDFRIDSTVDAADRLISALHQVDYADITITPEFVMPEEQADKLPNSLLHSFKSQPSRIIIAGSGPTQSTHEDLPWNEARIFNGVGKELWRQRKIWPAGLKENRAIECKLSSPGKHGLIMEYNAAGNEIVIVDADGLGRCVVLICQDLESLPLSEELLRQFQPDWVFTPVLDRDIKTGGWVHQRAFNLSALSQARFLVANSTTLARRAGSTDEPACGLAVGPKPRTDQDGGRRYNLVSIADKSSPGYAIITWCSNTEWKETTIS